MSSRCNRLNPHYILTLWLLYFISPLSSISCYVCQSEFPASSICLPPCSESFQMNSTCQLIRNIPLEGSDPGTLRADHITEPSVLAAATEKNFLLAEEAAYLSPSEAVGWQWEYGSMTYGCDTPGCNDPQNVNRLPNGLDASILDETLDRLLVGELISSCYQCDTCFDESVPNANMSGCNTVPCNGFSCEFVATRNSPTSTAQCGNAWRFVSSCISSRDYAQVDMTIMYYIRSKASELYQMQAICLSENCNNISTFTQLKDAVTINPDLTCLINGSSSSSTIPSPASPTVTGSATSTPTTTTSGSFADYILMSSKPFVFLIFFNIYITINY